MRTRKISRKQSWKIQNIHVILNFAAQPRSRSPRSQDKRAGISKKILSLFTPFLFRYTYPGLNDTIFPHMYVCSWPCTAKSHTYLLWIFPQQSDTAGRSNVKWKRCPISWINLCTYGQRGASRLWGQTALWGRKDIQIYIFSSRLELGLV